eukprot:gene9042-10342_t
MSGFQAEEINFCERCGALLPSWGKNGIISCNRCFFELPIASFANKKFFAKSRPYAFQKPDYNTSKDIQNGDATVSLSSILNRMLYPHDIEEKCPKCGREEMTYTTAQLRSADEGQTIFYRCACG